MDFTTKRTIIDQSVPALKSFLYQHSVAIVKAEDGDDLYLDDLSLASGTLVSIGNRLFVATASHAVPKDLSTRVWILGDERRQFSNSRFEILKRGQNTDDDPDVGFFELDQSDVNINHNQEFCPIDRIAIQGIGRPLRPVLLVGSPGEYVEIREPNPVDVDRVSIPAFVPTMISYYTIPLLRHEWPREAANSDPVRDILLSYPDTPATLLETGESICLPKPQGMSGGGLWDQGFEDGTIWSNQSSKLVGIFTGWNEKYRYTYAVQIVHWLRLIYSCYPDLRPILDEQFPQLAA